MSPPESDILTTANQAFEKFSHGLATGEWQSFLAMLTVDTLRAESNGDS